MKMHKIISLTLIASLMALILTSCVGGSGKKPEATSTDSGKPVLKVLMPYQPFDPNKDASAKRIADKTGYKAEYFMLPQKNANEKLMLEISSGNEYDLLRLNNVQFGQLAGQGALTEIDDLLNKFAPNVLKGISPLGWETAMVDGKKVGIPYEEMMDDKNPYGIVMSGIGVRTDIVKELNLSFPKDKDSFYTFFKKIKDAKGIEPLTGSGGFNNIIGSAFGMAGAEWFVVGGKVIPRIKMPQMKDYLEYMSKLYKDGIMDKDWPINKQEVTNQKFTSGKAVAVGMAFWDIPTILSALKKNNENAEIQFITPLNGSDGKPYLSVNSGVSEYEAIPNSSKKAEDVIKYAELRARPDIFLTTFLGDKGVHFEIKDGKYYPILPAFNELANSKQFTGIAPKGEGFKMWQARARKTPEMAKAYEEMNANVSTDIVHFDIFGYANALPEMQKYRMSLSKMEEDFFIKALVTTEPLDKYLAKFISDWEKQGGAELEKAVNTWYNTYKDAVK